MEFNDNTYTLLEEIGQGACGVVYKAIHNRLNKYVVIKQVQQSGYVPGRNEADMIKGLRHSYIPQVYDVIEQNGGTFIVMDYIDGLDFARLISGGAKFSQRQILKYFMQLCDAAAYLHSQKPPLIHSDIKPDNIMLTSSDDICLIDFNVSLAFDAEKQAIGGTRGYAPPEQLGIPLSDIKRKKDLVIGKSRPYVDMRSDIYSIGAAMYYIISGERPDLNYRTKPLSEIAPNVSDGLLHIIQRAMSLEPAKRYKTVSEMQNALRNVNKLDRRYISLKIRREVITVISAAAIVSGIFLNRQGASVLDEERQEKYSGYIEQIDARIEQNDFESAEDIISSAQKLLPEKLDAYYRAERILFLQEKYDECIDYPETIITAEMLKDDENTYKLASQMYIISAESAFELAVNSEERAAEEYYREAITLYEKGLFYDEGTAECYRNIVIANARIDNTEQAKQALSIAEKNDLSNDELVMLEGEILWAEGDFEGAYSHFESALELTSSDEIRYHIILAADKMSRDEDNTLSDSNVRMTAILEPQADIIAPQYSRVVTEMLAYYYIQNAEQTGNTEYYYKAAKIYDGLLDDNKLSYTLQKNYFNILYSKLGDYERCISLLDYMSSQAEDYWISMNYCYTYISIEQQKPIDEQDYSKAYECWLDAAELYSESKANDPDMDTLRESINTLITFGLIREG